MPRTCTILPLLPLLLLLLLAPATAAGQALPAHVRQALERGSQRLDPIHVVWRETYVPPRSRSETVSELRLDENEALFASTIRRLSLASGRFHQLCEYPGRADPSEASFDGAIFYHGYPEGRNDEPPQLEKTLLARVVREQPDLPLIESGYFTAVGFSIPATAPELSARHKPASSVLELLRREGAMLVGKTEMMVDGRAVLRVQVDAPAQPLAPGGSAERRHVFDLDIAMGYALRRYEERQDGHVLLVRMNDEFREIRPRNLWLPRRSRTDHYTWPTMAGTVRDQPVLTHLIEARSADGTEIPDDRFVLDYAMPGSRITDRSGREGSATVTVGGADGPLSREGSRLEASAGESGRGWRIASLAGSAAALAMIAAALILQRRRLRSGA